MNYNKEVLEKNIIFLQPDDPFTWASGIKSPIYCDNRLLLSYPELRQDVAKQLSSLVIDNNIPCDVVMGTSTAGIPHGAYVADILNLPYGYVRGDSKKHGRQNQIEGSTVDGCNVVVIEDLISTGKSVLEVINALKEAGAKTITVVAIFSYNLNQAKNLFNDENVEYYTISNIHQLVDYAKKEQLLTETDADKILDFVASLN